MIDIDDIIAAADWLTGIPNDDLRFTVLTVHGTRWYGVDPRDLRINGETGTVTLLHPDSSRVYNPSAVVIPAEEIVTIEIKVV